MQVLVRDAVTGKTRYVPKHYLDHPILKGNWVEVATETPVETPVEPVEDEATVELNLEGGTLEPGSPEPADDEGEEDAQDHR